MLVTNFMKTKKPKDGFVNDWEIKTNRIFNCFLTTVKNLKFSLISSVFICNFEEFFVQIKLYLKILAIQTFHSKKLTIWVLMVKFVLTCDIIGNMKWGEENKNLTFTSLFFKYKYK